MRDYRDKFLKCIDVYYNEEMEYWIAFVFPYDMYKRFQEAPEGSGAELKAIDVISALDEVTLLSRVKTLYPALVIGQTDGEVMELPL